jgi:hypothetical protein
MRRGYSLVRGVAAVAVIVALSTSVSAGPREDHERDRRTRKDTEVVKVVKRMIRVLGDFLTIPRP